MEQEWRCRTCSKLLGVTSKNRLQIRFARGHQYAVGLPAATTCRGCGTLNELAKQGPRSTGSRLHDNS